ncbi:hypothetical protein BU17DRAFT_54610, partial [Hysterangium stoloniferum]
GDFYRGCGCYIRHYYTGKTTDCNRTDCAKSQAHMHKTAPNCYCDRTYDDDRRVQNYFQVKCEYCIEEDRERQLAKAAHKRSYYK